MNAAQIVGDVVHDLLGMNVVVSKQVDVVVLSLQGPVLSPGISRAVQLQLPHLSKVKKIIISSQTVRVCTDRGGHRHLQIVECSTSI
jgi:hypothetical protein